MLGIPLTKNHHPYHLTLIPGVGLGVTAAAVMMLVVLIFLIRRKSRELGDFENADKTSSKSFPPWPMRKFQEGMVLDLLRLILARHFHISGITHIIFTLYFWGWGCGGGAWGVLLGDLV